MVARNSAIDGWKLLIALLVGIFLAAMVATFIIAAQRGTRVVDNDYYSHGLHYGRTASGAANPGIGWTLSPSVAGSDLRVCISDSSGATVCGGKLSFRIDTDGGGSRPITLAESTPGMFTAPRPVSPQGEIRGTLLYTRGEAVATRKLVLFQ